MIMTMLGTKKLLDSKLQKMMLFGHNLLAHLSRRLMGELIVYQSHRRLSVVRPSTCSNIFSSETTGPIKLKFHVDTPRDAGTKVCSNRPGHMTKMATTPIYGKNPLK